MAQLTLTRVQYGEYKIQYNTVYQSQLPAYVGKWTEKYYNDADYGAAAVKYTLPEIGEEIEPWTITVPVTFSQTIYGNGHGLYAALSTTEPNTSRPDWRYGPTSGIIGSEIQFSYNQSSLTFEVKSLSWLESNEIYLYLYSHDSGSGEWYNYAYLSNSWDATLDYIPAYRLSLNAGTGSVLRAARQSSEFATTGVLSDNAALYTNDSLMISVSPNTNYRILSLKVNGNDFTSGNTHTVAGDVNVVSVAQVLSSDVGATDADIESTSTITIARYDSSYVHSLHYSFGSLSGYLTAAGGISSTEVKITGTSVAFTIPASFYAEIPNAASGTCTITCRTYASTTSTDVLGDPTTCTFTVRASESLCSPVVTGTVADTNQTTLLLTGDSSKLVRYLSTALCTITASARNGASIVKKSIAGTEVSGNSISISGDALTQQSIRFAATDSRGYSSYVDVAITLIPYTKLTCNPEVNRTTPTDGGVSLSLTGMFYSGEWRDSVSNTLTVRYRYRESTASVFSDWRTITTGITIQTTGYKTNSPIALVDSNGSTTGFDYRNSYVFEFEAKDGDGTTDCMTVLRQATVQRGIPVFDWGEEDFRFNVPIYIGNTKLTEAQLQSLLALLS